MAHWCAGCHCCGNPVHQRRIERATVVSLAGPSGDPSLVETNRGRYSGLLDGVLPDRKRCASSPGLRFTNHKALGEVHGYLNRYDQQVTLLEEDRERHFLGWLSPGWSASQPFEPSFPGGFPERSSDSQPRRMVHTEPWFPSVCLKSDAAGCDAHIPPSRSVDGRLGTGEQLGCLELHGEDLALCL